MLKQHNSIVIVYLCKLIAEAEGKRCEHTAKKLILIETTRKYVNFLIQFFINTSAITRDKRPEFRQSPTYSLRCIVCFVPTNFDCLRLLQG